MLPSCRSLVWLSQPLCYSNSPFSGLPHSHSSDNYVKAHTLKQAGRCTVAMTASVAVQELESIHHSWQHERTAILDALLTAHNRAQQLTTTHDSLDAFQSSLASTERHALIEQIQQLCLDKLALKRQLHQRAKLYQPAGSFSSTSPGHASSSVSDIQLRHDLDELRLTVQRLRADNQYVTALSQQKEAELTAMEQTVQRVKREKERAEQKLLDAERREVRERERLAGLEEALRQCRDRERQLLEEKLDLQRELLRRRREDALGGGGRRTASVGSVEEVEEDGLDAGRNGGRDRIVDAFHLRVMAAESGTVSDSGGDDDVFSESQEHGSAAALSSTF